MSFNRNSDSLTNKLSMYKYTPQSNIEANVNKDNDQTLEFKLEENMQSSVDNQTSKEEPISQHDLSLPSSSQLNVDSLFCRITTLTTTTIVSTISNTMPINNLTHSTGTVVLQSQNVITSPYINECKIRSKQRQAESSLSDSMNANESKIKKSKLDPNIKGKTRKNSDKENILSNVGSETHVHISVPVSNKYALLENPDMEVQVMDKQENSPLTMNKGSTAHNHKSSSQIPRDKAKMKIPPITLKMSKISDDFFKFNRDIQRKLSNPLKIAYSSDGIKYFTSTSADYDILYKYFKGLQLPFYSHEINKQKTIQVVLKRLPSSVTPKMLEEELTLLGFNIIHVRQMTKQQMQLDGTVIKQPLAAWVITLPLNDHSTTIYQLRDLNNHLISIERYQNAPHVIQCHRCQAVGHTATHCHMPLRCVKCGGEHTFSDCDKKGDKYIPTCANCNGQHTATYSQCSYICRYKTQLEMKQQQRKQNTFQSKQTEDTRNSISQTSENFPELTQHRNIPLSKRIQPPTGMASSTLNKNTNSSIGETLQEIKNLFSNINVLEIISTLRTTAEKLKTAPDTLTKITTLFDGVCSLIDAFFK